jgi:predicted negative regulator of RcsB-dependent stress response
VTAVMVLGCVVVTCVAGLVAWRWWLDHTAGLVQARAETLRREESALPEKLARVEERLKALEYRNAGR